MEPKITRINNQAIRRLIRSRFPTVDIFEDLAGTKAEQWYLMEVEGLTNTRLGDAMQHLTENDIISGDGGASYIMNAHIHGHEDGDRFCDGRLGAWYGAFDIQTAIRETLYHQRKRQGMSDFEYPIETQMRELVVQLDNDLIDLRGLQDSHPELYHPTDYSKSQAFANNHRWPLGETGVDGVIYDSLRHEGGTNVVLWHPRAVNRPVIQAAHYQYNWSDNDNVTVSQLEELEKLSFR